MLASQHCQVPGYTWSRTHRVWISRLLTSCGGPWCISHPKRLFKAIKKTQIWYWNSSYSKIDKVGKGSLNCRLGKDHFSAVWLPSMTVYIAVSAGDCAQLSNWVDVGHCLPSPIAHHWIVLVLQLLSDITPSSLCFGGFFHLRTNFATGMVDWNSNSPKNTLKLKGNTIHNAMDCSVTWQCLQWALVITRIARCAKANYYHLNISPQFNSKTV